MKNVFFTLSFLVLAALTFDGLKVYASCYSVCYEYCHLTYGQVGSQSKACKIGCDHSCEAA